MSRVGRDVVSALFGRIGQTGVTRGVAEFHAGRPLIAAGKHRSILALPIDGLNEARLAEFVGLCAPLSPSLAITARRAHALGLHAEAATLVRFGDAVGVDAIVSLATGAKPDVKFESELADATVEAAISLAKLSQTLPALLVAEIADSKSLASAYSIVTLSAESVARFREARIKSLRLVSRANVPLKFGSRASFVVFRDDLGESPAAIIIGEPDLSKPVPVRVHSACLTGDVFGSRRCDCGDQLTLSLNRLEELGGGVVLYLPQEGRGLGLANKMRCYELQDAGLDTIDANTALGFDEDERDYGIAARMLQMLDCKRILLMTNNPAKVEGLAQSGIEIAGRIPVEAPIHVGNRRYLSAKALRAGHRLDPALLSAL
jgi:GTP cyclohydrolase II